MTVVLTNIIYEDFLRGVPCALRVKLTGIFSLSHSIGIRVGPLCTAPSGEVRAETRVWRRKGEHEELEKKSLKFRKGGRTFE